MNLNMLIDSLCSFKIKFLNNVEVSNMPLEIRVVDESCSLYKICKFKGIILDEYGKKVILQIK